MDHNEFAGPTQGRHRRARRPGSSSRAAPSWSARPIPSCVAVLHRRAAASRAAARRATSTCSRTSSRSAAGWSTCARRRRSTPTCSCRCTARHQGDNAVVALTAVEAFFAAPLADDVVARGLRRRRDARPLRGARPPAAGDRRRRPQPARRRLVRAGVLRRLRPRRPADPRRRHACAAAIRGDARGAARRRVRRRRHAAPRRRPRHARRASSPRPLARSAATR